jgi:hypothetical protein
VRTPKHVALMPDNALAASGHATTAPPSAASNSRRPMVTVIRPSRARCVGNDTTPRARCPNCAAPARAGRHAGLRPQRIAAAGRVLAAISCARRDPWALGTRSDESAVSVVYGGIRPRCRCRALPPIPDSARPLGMRCWPWYQMLPPFGAFLIWSRRPGAHRRAFFH